MNAAEATRLLMHAAAFDSRQPSVAAAEAWAAALHDVPLDNDTLAAVARYYGDLAPGERFDPNRRRWLEPHHVRYHRQQIRNARIATANALYSGDPDETPAEALNNQRALTQAAADGHLPATPPRAAIESGHGIDATGKGRAILRSVGRESLSRRPEHAAPCPICDAPTGRPCHDSHGKRRREAHPSRIESSHRIAAGLPPLTRADLEREEQQRRDAARAATAQDDTTEEASPR